MSGISRTTTDPKTIKRWAEARGGIPASVPGTSKGGAGLIRIHFPDYDESTDSLETIGWDAFFAKLKSESLAIVYQEATSDGEISRFNKIISA